MLENKGRPFYNENDTMMVWFIDHGAVKEDLNMDDLTMNTTQDPTNPDLEGKWLSFWLDGQLYGSSIVHVEQIVSMMPITEVPEYPHYAKGIINIRGSIVPLIDLRLRLGKEEAAYTDHTCIIICRIGEDQIGFIAGISGIIGVICAIKGYALFAKKESVKDKINFVFIFVCF